MAWPCISNLNRWNRLTRTTWPLKVNEQDECFTRDQLSTLSHAQKPLIKSYAFKKEANDYMYKFTKRYRAEGARHSVVQAPERPLKRRLVESTVVMKGQAARSFASDTETGIGKWKQEGDNANRPDPFPLPFCFVFDIRSTPCLSLSLPLSFLLLLSVPVSLPEQGGWIYSSVRDATDSWNCYISAGRLGHPLA